MIVVVGSINMDLVFSMETLPQKGQTVLAKSMESFEGGKGANQAVACARLGGNTVMVGAVGNDAHGERLRAGLRNEGIDISFVSKHDEMPTGTAAIFVEKTGSNMIAVQPGANAAVRPRDAEAALLALPHAKVTLMQLETPLDTVEAALATAARRGMVSILNPAPAMDLPPELLRRAVWLTPNETELEALTGEAVPEEGARKLLERGLKHIVVTLGEEGALYADARSMVRYPAHKVRAVDTTAAGDCFNGALAVGLAGGWSIEDTLAFAGKASALTVQRQGAQQSIPTKAEVTAWEGADR